MRFGETRLEFKIGIFVFIGLVILSIFILLIGNFKVWTQGYRINFLFNFVNGLKPGSPIRFAGVDVGEVRRIDFLFSPQENATKIRVIGWIRKDVKVPSDSTVWVNTLGLLGEKYLEIIPGKDYANLIKEDQMLLGRDPVAMHEVGTLAKNIAMDVNILLRKIKEKEGTIGRLLYDDTLYRKIENLTQELEAFVQDIKLNPWKLFFRPKQKPQKK